jgi:hypothetical protein
MSPKKQPPLTSHHQPPGSGQPRPSRTRPSFARMLRRTAGCPARSSQDGSWMKQPILSQAGSRQCGAQPPTRSRNAAFSDGGAGSISSALTSVVSTLKSAGGGHYRCAPSGCLSRLLSCLCWMASSQTATHRPVAEYWVQPRCVRGTR